MQYSKDLKRNERTIRRIRQRIDDYSDSQQLKLDRIMDKLKSNIIRLRSYPEFRHWCYACE